MNNHGESFGRQAMLTTTPATFLVLEAQVGHSDRFAEIDALVDSLLRRSLSGEQVSLLTTENRTLHLTLSTIDTAQRTFLDREFVLEDQQARGAWGLPEEATLKLGWANFPHHLHNQPRYATGITTAERGKVQLYSSADGLFFWSVLEPLFGKLYYPFELRGPLAGTKDRDWQRNAWHDAEVFLEAIGFEVRDSLAAMRYGGGWSRLRAPEQIQAKQALMQAMRHQAERPHAALFRAYQIQQLIARYYRHTKKNSPKMRQVVTGELRPILAGYFHGDWLAFLAYIGEEPHPDERIASALPETRLVVADQDRIAEVAAAQGLPVSEVERALAAFWGSDKASSPIEERVAVLKDYWHEFNPLHARQQSGMPPLWGLVEEGGISLRAQGPYHPGLYRTLLTPELLLKVDRLWGTSMLTRWPDRLVSTISPHGLMSETYGPALKFWHGCALTAWFVCEGPSSRTDLAGLAAYHDRELKDLAQLGCPVDPTLFEELQRAERQLGPQRNISDPERTTRHDIGDDWSVTLELSIGSRRDGFVILRDIISRYRQAWSERFLSDYLRFRWETEIRDAARDLSLLSERKGKAPTPRQFATHAAQATNHWFGGDMSGLYRMIGEKSPFEPKRHQIMPADRETFARSVYERLVAVSPTLASKTTGDPFRDELYQDQARWKLQWMAEESLRFLQREEAVGQSPTLDEFGREGFSYRASVLSSEIDAAWSVYQDAVKVALHSSRGSSFEAVLPSSPASLSSFSQQEHPPETAPQTERKPFWRRLLRAD